ncbi:hypothetical protein D3C75_781710 [compost metagenome]
MKAARNLIVGTDCNRLKLFFIQFTDISFDPNVPEAMVSKFGFKYFCPLAGANVNIRLFAVFIQPRVVEIPMFIQSLTVFKCNLHSFDSGDGCSDITGHVLTKINDRISIGCCQYILGLYCCKGPDRRMRLCKQPLFVKIFYRNVTPC